MQILTKLIDGSCDIAAVIRDCKYRFFMAQSTISTSQMPAFLFRFMNLTTCKNSAVAPVLILSHSLDYTEN